MRHSNFRFVFFMFCDHDGSDPLGFKIERFTIFASILITVFLAIYGLPLSIFLFKLFFKFMFYCCEYEVEEIVEDEPEES